MDIQEAFLCIDCEEIYQKNRHDTGEYSYLINRYNKSCPKCGSEESLPLGVLIAPLSERRMRLVSA